MIRRVLFSTLCVRPPLSDLAAVKKHAFAPKRIRKRGYMLRNTAKEKPQRLFPLRQCSVSGAQYKRSRKCGNKVADANGER